MGTACPESAGKQLKEPKCSGVLAPSPFHGKVLPRVLSHQGQGLEVELGAEAGGSTKEVVLRYIPTSLPCNWQPPNS